MAELALAGLEAIGTGLLGKVGQWLFDPAVREIKSMRRLDSNITELETQLQVLERTIQGVQLRVEDELRNARVIDPNLEDWRTRANTVTTEARKIIDDTNKVEKGCLNGWCPNLPRYSLSKKAVEITKTAADLKAEGDSYTTPFHGATPACLKPIAIGDFMGFESRKLNMEEILNALKHDEINLIGICGMGGTGKTTMAKEVAKRVKQDGLFVEVAMAVVGKLERNPGQEPDLTDVQVRIADVLGLKNLRATESSIARADLLRTRLLQDDKRILVILDDVWEEFDLKATGIPLEGTNKNFKMLYTSRTRDLWHHLRTRKKQISLGPLSEDEAWQLFREKAGDLADDWDLQPIAKKIVNECGNLPLALVLIGGALSKKSGGNAKEMWGSMLDQLIHSSRTPTGDDLYSRLELSYKYLEDDEAKKLFLLCCLFGEDEEIHIEDLVRYTFGLSLFYGMNQIGEVRRRVFFIVDDLKSRYLLLDSEREPEERVKVHDVVRDMGISIASKAKFALVRHGEISHLPKTDVNEHYTALSVISEKIKELPTGLTNPDLKFLMLRCKKLEKMPPNFFEAIENLKVLELHQFRGILTLQSLRNLTTLSLDQFDGTLENVSLIGDLLNLEILSIKNSKIKEQPKEIGKLVNLKLLDLRGTWFPIPSGVISSLIQLEELYVGKSTYWEGEEKEKEEGRNANLRELELLPNLNTLEISMGEDVLIPKAPIFSKLTTYKVSIGIRYVDDYDLIKKCKRVLMVHSSIPIPSNRGGIDSLLRSSDCLVLVGEGCNDLVKDIICCNSVPVRLFQEKTYIRLENCGGLEQVIWKESQEDINVATNRIEFPKLEALELGKLPNLVGFCKGIDHIDFFQLKTFCKGIDHIDFFQLKTLRLEDIPQLNLLFHNNSNLSSNSEQNGNVNLFSLFPQKVSLPSLDVLQVAKLQSSVRLGDVQHSVGSLSKLKDVSMRKCNKLLSVFSSQWISMLQQLQSLKIESCESLEVAFEWEGLESQEPHPEILSALKYVELKNLPKLNCISKRGFVWYKYIQTLQIEDCNSLRCVFEPTMTKSVPHLRKLRISKCQMLSTIVAGENGLGESSVNEVEFPQLKELELHYLPSLVSFFPNANMNGTTLAKSTDHHHLFNAKVSLRSLEVLKVIGLDNLERLVDIPLSEGSLSKLKDISVCGCGKLLSVFPSQLIPMLQELQTLTVQGCDSLKVLIEWEGLDSLRCVFELRRLRISRCTKLLTIVAIENGLGESSMGEVEFPQLEEVDLNYLPSLVSFFPNANVNSTTLAKSTDHHDNPLLPQPLSNEKDIIPSFEYLVPALLQCKSSRSFSRLKIFRAQGCANLRNIPMTSIFGDLDSTKESLPEFWLRPCNTCMALSEDDWCIYSACGGWVSEFYEGSVRETFGSLSPAPTFLALHRDIMAIVMEDSTIRLFMDGLINSVKSKLEGHKKRITGLSFSTKLDIMVSSGADAQLCTWSMGSWSKYPWNDWKLEKLKSVPLRLPTGEVHENDTRVQFHSDGIHLLVSHEAQLAIYNASEMDCIRQWVPHDVLPAPISSAVYSCDSQLVYTTFCDGNIGVFDAYSLALGYHITPSMYLTPALLSGSQDVYPTIVAAHPNRPNKFAIGLTQGSVIVFVEPQESEGQWGLYPTSDNQVARLLYTNSGDGILALGSNGAITQWGWDFSLHDPSGKTTSSVLPQWRRQWRGPASDLAAMKNDVTGVNLKEAVPCMALSKDDWFIFSAFYTWTCEEEEETFSSAPPASTFLACHQDKNIMAIGKKYSSIHVCTVFQLEDGTLDTSHVISELDDHKARITDLSFSTKLNILVSSGVDAQLCTWSLGSWSTDIGEWKPKKLKSVLLQLPTGKVRSLFFIELDNHVDTRAQFHSDGIHLLVSHEALLSIYDATEMDCIHQWVPHDVLLAPISSAVYSCDSQLVYTTFCDANIGVFDADSLMLRYRIAPSTYLGPTLLNRSYVYPNVIAAHPNRPNQFAIGLTQGVVIILEPPESEGEWGLSPTVDNVMLNETTASPSTTSNDIPDQVKRKKEEEKGKGILYG